jgi:hypothetical protein
MTMRQSTIGRGLLILGALVGTAAGVALALGLGVSDIPPWMITVGMYKLAFIAAGGLLVAGAVVGRAAMRRTHAGETDASGQAIGAGPWTEGEQPLRQSETVDRDRRRQDGT